MKHNRFVLMAMCALLLLAVSVPGVFAVWSYFGPPEPVEVPVPTTMGEFKYGLLYITGVVVDGGAYSTASVIKADELDISANIKLNQNTSSTVKVAVTVYNSTDVSYYYKETETVSASQQTIGYTLSGLEQKQEIPARSYYTFYVTFAFTGNSTSNPNLQAQLHFNFVVDKNSIGTIVAQTAVDRFAEILNDAQLYDYLTDAMDDTSLFGNRASKSYIGNVSGAADDDSAAIEYLFGDEFMSMDLDGDGKAEPITIMIKRENVDGNTSTGDSYHNGLRTVYGNEMTLYITSVDLSKVSNGASVVVYAATFTKKSGSSTWEQIIPLTKGSADANRYYGLGSANSFDTGTWKSEDKKTISQLIG